MLRTAEAMKSLTTLKTRLTPFIARNAYDKACYEYIHASHAANKARAAYDAAHAEMGKALANKNAALDARAAAYARMEAQPVTTANLCPRCLNGTAAEIGGCCPQCNAEQAEYAD